ncbi:MAG: beta-ketoacyl-ACP synthase II [Anaerolineales bacterium]|nr:beta-ketoacyl-ACP synthase II [Anaerolineales bacterium]
MKQSKEERTRVVITGLGVVTPIGNDLETFWQALLDGKSGVRKITTFNTDDLPCKIAGEILEFQPEDYMPKKVARRMARASQLALAAAQMAVENSSLPVPLKNAERVGVYFGTALGGWDRADQGIQILRTQGLARVNPFYVPSALPNMPAFHITQHYRALGPNSTVTTACATGTQAVGEAAHAIRHGKADVIIAGGVEGLIVDFAIAGFATMRALPTSFNDEPERASRPFDAKREGFVLSEGAASLVLESLDHAQARGAHIYAEVAGYASSSDGFHVAVPDPSAAGAIRTMDWALKDASLATDQVTYINAHGTSTPANDTVETHAIKSLFSDMAYKIPISSTKSMIGHALGASGAIEAIVCTLSIDRGKIHGTMNYEYPDPELDLDYVPNESRDLVVDVALSNSFGLGGQNACLVLKRVE